MENLNDFLEKVRSSSKYVSSKSKDVKINNDAIK